MLLAILSTPLLAFILYRVYKLAYNYRAARKFGIPIILLPASFDDPWWNIIKPLLPWVKNLPFGLGSWYFYTDIGWPMIDGMSTISRLGEEFVLVSPTSVHIITAHPSAVETILKDYKTWIRPAALAQLLAIYGPNLVTTNGTEWQRHRKITGSAFTERTMRGVWEAGRHNSSRALDFEKMKEPNIAELQDDLEVLALGVLTSVAFGQDNDLTEVPSGHRETLRDSLSIILKNVFVTIAFANINIPNQLLPKFLRKVKASIAEFRLYMEESLLQQMKASGAGSKEKDTSTLLEAMVAANEAGKDETWADVMKQRSAKLSYLTDSDLYGNLFIFNVGGYETTAGTLTFTLPYLAAHPQIQDWIIEELDAHYAPALDLDYDAVYPKLVRSLAVMYETLRLATPAAQLVREAGTDTLLAASGRERGASMVVPAGTLVSVHIDGVHLAPAWGPDADLYDPKRFVVKSPSTGEELLSVPKGVTYLPWVSGPRVCPGKKFSQVEFVSVIAHILSKYRIEIVQHPHETLASAESRVKTLLKDKHFNGSAHIRKATKAKLKFVRRSA